MKNVSIIALVILALVLGFMYYKCRKQSRGFQQNVDVIVKRLDIEYNSISQALKNKLPEDVRGFYIERRNKVGSILNNFYGTKKYEVS